MSASPALEATSREGDPAPAPSLLALPAWTSAIEDVQQTIRHSIGSWRSILPPQADDAPEEDPEKALAAPAPPPTPPPLARPLTVLSLPVEIQVQILAHLSFADIERCRRTCKQLRCLARPEIMRLSFRGNDLREQILKHCRLCLFYDGSGRRLLHAQPGRDYPFSAKCLECALRTRDARLSRFHISEKILLADNSRVWVCRWCAVPVLSAPARGHAQFHVHCYREYTNTLLCFFVAGWLQLALGVVGFALALRYFRDAAMVFAPGVVRSPGPLSSPGAANQPPQACFILQWFCIFLLLFRGNLIRTYGVAFCFEVTILGLWLPQMYHVAQIWAHAEDGRLVPASTRAFTAVVALNM